VPLFTVLIPTYNRRQRLLRALDSVFSQTFGDYEVVVVDDGSTDGTAEALKPLEGKIQLLRQDNRGPAAARNLGAQHASGEYLAFLDSDDWWFPWSLKELAAAIAETRQPTWVYGRDAEAGEQYEAQAAAAKPSRFVSFPNYAAGAAADGLMPFPSGVAISREYFLSLRGFSEAMPVAEDLDLWFRLGHANGFVRIYQPPLFCREIHQGNQAHNVARSYCGMLEVVAREREGAYRQPDDWRDVRHGILTKYLIFYALDYRRRGYLRQSLRFYCEVLRLQAESAFREPHFGGSRNRFLVSYPLYFVSPGLHGALHGVAHGAPAEDGRVGKDSGFHTDSSQ
jgi:glycosyltransferase involved in cell wall biosynthesis